MKPFSIVSLTALITPPTDFAPWRYRWHVTTATGTVVGGWVGVGNGGALDWSPTTTYATGAHIHWLGQLYTAIGPNLNADPSTRPDKWAAGAPPGIGILFQPTIVEWQVNVAHPESVSAFVEVERGSASAVVAVTLAERVGTVPIPTIDGPGGAAVA